MTCRECGRFFLQSPREHLFSHNVPIIYTDGACRNNGNDGAKAGYGVALGDYPEDQFWFSLSGNARRTSQRAELAGVSKGVSLAVEAAQEGDRGGDCWGETEFNFIVIATDSEYAVNGVTKWLPEWKENGFRTSSGRRPQNESAFRKIDNIITLSERQVSIGLWHIPRE
ncbi:ribonuclease H-like domain-containing protein [Phyllosticta citrichinensis]|uniref:ribonuclease H n=1 Tax=Phyllosticta citrichinensis TaxID=1130410 RepID=A0ABR1XV69_9PEZI